MLKKFFVIFIINILAIGMYGSVNAADLKTELNIIQKSSETKNLENDQGFISKTIVDSNKDTGEATIEIKVSNTAKEQEQTEKYENTEIYILVSENMVNDEEKKEKYINNIENLVSKILAINTKTKVGIIGIKGPIADVTYTEEGNAIIGEKDEGKVKGSEKNAEIVAELTNNLDEIKSNLQNMNSSKTSYRNNLQAAIRLANSSYSNNTNKILISLYDGVPSTAIGVEAVVSFGGWLSEYATLEEAVIGKHEKIATYTKNEILKLKSSNVSFLLLRPDDTSYDESWYDLKTGVKDFDFDGSPYVQKLYGTIDNPTYGKMYTYDDNNIDSIIKENIYEDVKDLLQADINNVKIVDYFPNDIMDNFEFSYVGNPNVGTVSDTIDKENRTITWNLGTVKANEVATLKYKLKIKDMKNTKLLNKDISTNEKVVLTYKDIEAKDYTVELTSSPKIRLSEIKEDVANSINYDPTTANGKIPQTGINVTSIILTIMMIMFIVGVLYKKYNSYKDIK